MTDSTLEAKAPTPFELLGGLGHVGLHAPWLFDGTWAKASVILVSTWLTVPYFFLVSLGALQSIPDELVDTLIVHGSPEACREHIGRYQENGITTPALAILPFGIDQRQAIRDLAPR